MLYVVYVETCTVIIAPVPHLNKSLARSNKNPFYQGFLTGIATINLRELLLVMLSYYYNK